MGQAVRSHCILGLVNKDGQVDTSTDRRCSSALEEGDVYSKQQGGISREWKLRDRRGSKDRFGAVGTEVAIDLHA